MATQNTLRIINYLQTNIAVSVSNNNWNCCDEPAPGQTVGNIGPGGQFAKLVYCRKDGHGCNGEQGEFALSITLSGGPTYNLPLNFDSDGGMAQAPDVTGLGAYVKQQIGGTYDLALVPPPSSGT